MSNQPNKIEILQHSTSLASCDSCGWQGPVADIKLVFPDIPHLNQRLDPDGIVPAGECPECGALAYHQPSRWTDRAQAENVLAQLLTQLQGINRNVKDLLTKLPQ